MQLMDYRRRIYGLFKSIVRILLAVYILLGLILYFKQSSFLFQPTKDVVENPGDINLKYESVDLKTPDGLKLSAWYVPANDANLTLVFCHGNGGNISHRLANLQILNDLGVNCLIFDYRGYGNSGGKPSEKGVYLDAQTAYDWLINEKKISPENIIIYGQSLGGSVATHLASEVKARGLIIESTFTSFTDVASHYYPYLPVKLFAKFRFNTFENLKKVKYPVLIIHSSEDDLIPYKFGQRLYKEAANEPKKFVEISGTHNEGFLTSGQVYIDGLSNWFKFIEKYNQ
jgi:fermentation-respiration switch protein FrsA (DUF1100 family)